MSPDPLSELRDDPAGRVIVIGSGMGGGSLAWRLAHNGREVLLIEQGGYLKPPPRPGKVGQFIADVHGDRVKPIQYVGGQTKFYGAALYRYRESDFRAVEHENGVSPAWPFGYDTLEPYYEAAEALYKVHGSPAGDPSEPPRAHAYPFPPIEHAPVVERMVGTLERAGVPVAAIPRGIDRRVGGACVLCADCDAHVCTVDAKMDAEIAAVRPALATGRVKLLLHTEVLKVLTDDSGRRATGVLVRRDGEEAVLHADTVVVSAGLPASALLLRRSANTQHPEGVGNHSGALGKYLAGHSTGMVFPLVSVGQVKPAHTKSFAIHAWYEGSPGWAYPTGVIQVAGQMPFWEEASRLMRPVVKVVATHSLTCFYMTEALPTAETGLVFDGDKLAGRVEPVQNLKTFHRLRQLAVKSFAKAGYPSIARRRPPYMWHDVGTARMGDDPATSVVDANLQVHGVEGLYVADASVMPSAGAVNTGLTIAALAMRLGDHLAGAASATDKAPTIVSEQAA